MSELLTVADIAGALRVHRQSVYRLIWAGGLPAFRIGRRWRVPRPALDEFVTRNIKTAAGAIRAATIGNAAISR